MGEPWKTIEHDGRKVDLWLDEQGNPTLNNPDGDEPIADPEAKARSSEAAKYRVRAKHAAAEATRLRIERAFLIEAAKAGVRDLDAALKLADLNTVQVSDDGAVAGVEDVVAALIDEREYLVAAPQPVLEPELPNGGRPSGAPMNRDRNKAPTGLDRRMLEEKYPALRGRRPWRR